MKGFDDKALILFPKWENYEGKPFNYKYQFKKAVQNVIDYLLSCNITPYVFYTDDVARAIGAPEFKWICTLGKADRFFISKYCDGCSEALTKKMLFFEDIYNDLIIKEPYDVNASPEEKFEVILRRSVKASNKIIPLFKIVVNFTIPNKSQYRVTIKPGDGKIRILINARNFYPKAYISGSEENICDLLELPCASRTVDLWEVDNGNRN